MCDLVFRPPPLLPYHDPACGSMGLDRPRLEEVFAWAYFGETYYYATLDKVAHRVKFPDDAFTHVCFKEPQKNTPRTIWKPERAERILLVGFTFEHPTRIYQESRNVFKFLYRTASPQWPWFMVVTDRSNQGEVTLVTAYPLTHDQAKGKFKVGKRIK